ncbi:MAG: diphthine synthase [Nanoarchaeota archaeon]|nr:diphthine synthase [Nanoarchaeota archaeon]
MLYLIGLGLTEKSITKEALEIIKKCKKIYLESYTVEFPYKIEELEKNIGKKVEKLLRGDVESLKLVNEAKKENICLLIYGSPLFATTHQTLINDTLNNGIKVKTIYNASVFDVIGETGLQLYKFGKISSMPRWQQNYRPDSFLDFVVQNISISAHSIILVDIGLKFEDALLQLDEACKKRNVKLDKIVIVSCLGTEKSSIYYGILDKLKDKKILVPYCFIIPSYMHFVEEECLKRFLVL